MNIVVVGSLNMDVIVSVDPYPGPGETVTGGPVSYVPGGKGANQALAAARLGANVTLLGMLGADNNAMILKHALRNDGVNVEFLQTDPGPSGMAFVHLERDGTNRIILSPGANCAFSPDKVLPFLGLISTADAVLVQLEIPLDTVRVVLDTAYAAGVPTFLDPAPVNRNLFNQIHSVDWITPNEHEAELLTGQSVRDAKTARIAAAKLMQLGAKRVLLKVGAEGVYVADENGVVHQPSFAISPVDTTAAGDAFSAAFVVDYLQNRNVQLAARHACAAGAMASTKMGAQPSLPYRKEVLDFLERSGGVQAI